MNILYVEDNADIRSSVVELIKHADRHIVACADAETAWQHMLRAPVDVLVTDVNLPGCSGTELARRWVQADASRWVILYSGYAFPAGLAGLGDNVRAIPKEDFEQLDEALSEIGQQLQLCGTGCSTRGCDAAHDGTA